MDGNCNSVYYSVAFSFVLLISEVLPFIKSVEGQGIIDALYKLLKNKKEYQEIPDIENQVR